MVRGCTLNSFRIVMMGLWSIKMVFIYSRGCDKFPLMAILNAICESLERDILLHFFFNTFCRDQERVLLRQLNMIHLLYTIHESRSVVYHHSRGVHDQNAKVKERSRWTRFIFLPLSHLSISISDQVP